jgi:predicted permease
VISYGLWQRRFGGSPDILGATVRINGQPFTIIGVTPEKFHGTDSVIDVDLYIPVMMLDHLYPRSKSELEDRESGDFWLLARLKQESNLDTARASLRVLASQVESEYPALYKDYGIVAVSERNARPRISISTYVPAMAASFMGLVGLILLIACANVANLNLARSTSRQKEMAIRSALGASRLRLVRQLLTESILLALAGAIGGLVLALWATDLISRIKFSADLPVRFDFSLDWRVFAFTLIVSLGTGIIAGQMPALQISRLNLNNILKEGGRRAVFAGRQRLRSIFVVCQVAAALLVLICAGLFVQSFKNAREINLGFRKDNILMFSVDPGVQGYDRARAERFYRQLVDRLKTLPGVRSASLSTTVPFGNNNNNTDVSSDELGSAARDDRITVLSNCVGTGYFQTLGIPLVDGRDFSERDNESSPKVCIVNEAIANLFWPGQDALGKRLRLSGEQPNTQVIGVVKNGKYIFLGEEPRPFLYLPLGQQYQSRAIVSVFTQYDPGGLRAAARQAVNELDSDLAVFDLKTMPEHLNNGIAFMLLRIGAIIVGIFGLIAVVLAVVGVYGVLSYSVSQRTQEVGIRMALGARPREILGLLIGQGVVLALIGITFGLAASFALTRFLSSLLDGVSATDALTFVAISLALTAVVVLASYIPARRATKVDPMVALHYE